MRVGMGGETGGVNHGFQVNSAKSSEDDATSTERHAPKLRGTLSVRTTSSCGRQLSAGSGPDRGRGPRSFAWNGPRDGRQTGVTGTLHR